MSLPGAAEPTTILEELNRNFIHPVVAQVTQQSVNENERTHDLNNDNNQVIDVGKYSQLSESNCDVRVVCKDDEQIIQSDNVCDTNQNEVEILNFDLQTVDNTEIDEKLGQTEIIDQVKNTICEKSRDDSIQESININSDNVLPPPSHPDAKLLREVSPPPVPLVTYRWEDVRRDKQKVRFKEVKSFSNYIMDDAG